MNVFHVIFDTSVLRKTPFGHPNFKRLLQRVQQGVAKVYIPYIALEERRTQLVDEHAQLAEKMRTTLREMQRGQIAMLIDGLPEPDLLLPTKEDVDRNSCRVFGKYLADNKVEILPITSDHASNAWGRYFGVKPPFNHREIRENRRKDIPDSWILEAALDVKAKTGRHCVLIVDGKLEAALADAGFELWDDVEKLDAEIERATAVSPIRMPVPTAAMVPLDQLRSLSFDKVDIIVLGMNEVLGSPSKEKLFATLERVGVNRLFAEHEAKTLVLSEVMVDTGSHLIPTNRALAKQAAQEPLVLELLMKAIS
ncbi:PIN domain-containing protein [Undibacterium rugosum]|uniref:PIN domain-containing protein n=1 Tax=Undibacterium rugosum TaxID=2762291 RepID=UPI001B844808|nr:PIN domain-containing protein [Undibacterium rugosum]MBR7780254.1 DUF4935 domain-containing protein [Undibacterium rugosum]